MHTVNRSTFNGIAIKIISLLGVIFKEIFKNSKGEKVSKYVIMGVTKVKR